MLDHHVINHEHVRSLFMATALDKALQYHKYAIWSSQPLDGDHTREEVFKALQIQAEPVREQRHQDEEFLICSEDHGLFDIELYDHRVEVEYYCNDYRLWDEEILPALEKFEKKHEIVSSQDRVPIIFSYKMGSQIMTPSRKLACPQWKSIRHNYTEASDIQALMKMEAPYDRGKLVLWHGPPGCGKTYAIRALVREWSERANVIYAIDPETLLTDPSYLYDLLLDEENHETSCETINYARRKRPRRRRRGFGGSGERFILLILEDALSFVLEENRRHLGPQMSRLLNLTDGFIGQGLRLVIVMTTNEELKKIDPAFTRPGRILQVKQFQPFTPDQARAWCKSMRVEMPAQEQDSYTLGELYGQTASETLILGETREALGFR